MHQDHISDFFKASADSAFICSIVIVRPNKVKGIIQKGNMIFNIFD